MAHVGVAGISVSIQAQARTTARRIAVCILISITLLPAHLSAFFQGTHKTITAKALERFPNRAQLSDWERKELVDATSSTDVSEGGWWPPGVGAPYEPRFHFDSDLNFRAVLSNFQDLMRHVRENLTRPEKAPHGFGKILHALEDFYSHSNYVLLYRQYRAARNLLVTDFPLLEEALLHPEQYPGFQTVLETSLRTGYYPNHDPVKDTDHGSALSPRGRGMNKDTFLRSYNQDAKDAAVAAAAWYIKLYLKDPNVVWQCETAWQVKLIS